MPIKFAPGRDCGAVAAKFPLRGAAAIKFAFPGGRAGGAGGYGKGGRPDPRLAQAHRSRRQLLGPGRDCNQTQALGPSAVAVKLPIWGATVVQFALYGD